jgi:predicted amidohydrolase
MSNRRIPLVFLGAFLLCCGIFAVRGGEIPDGKTVVPALLHDADWYPDCGGWKTWAQREEISPRFWVDREVSLEGGSSLAISGDRNPAAHGRWEKTVPGIEGESWYRLTANFKAEGVPYERQHVVVRLDWLDVGGNRAGQPDYLTKNTKHGEWRQTTGTFQSPKQARAVKIELHLAWSPNGTVWWDDISLEKVSKPKGRPVTLAAVFHRPQGSKSPQESVRQFCQMLERAAEEKPDIVCLPEAINMIGTGLSYVEAAEPVPGPSTKALGIVAKRHRFYVVAGLLERDGDSVCNTAVLLNRDGQLVGKYRKAYLPREEVEGGVTPGDGYPVFETDFGIVGMMICYDLQYVDPARALAAQGADVILLPIWGGNVTLAKARAIENQVHLVTSGYDMPTFIIDTQGEILVQASREKSIVSTAVDLDERIRLPWLGDMKARFWKEWRADVKTPHWPQ